MPCNIHVLKHRLTETVLTTVLVVARRQCALCMAGWS